MVLGNVRCFKRDDKGEASHNIFFAWLSWEQSVWVSISPASAGDARDMSSIPGLERSPGGGDGNLLQNSSLENSMDKKSLLGYRLWSLKESDMTEHRHTPNSVIYIYIFSDWDTPVWYRDWQTFSVKLQIVKVLRFAASITAALLLPLEGSRGQSKQVHGAVVPDNCLQKQAQPCGLELTQPHGVVSVLD